MKKHYLVYQITNLINDKIYIGIHGTDDLEDGYLGSGTNIQRAINKHGIENFRKDILFDFDNPDEMIAKERELVDRKFIARKDVYNIALGGKGWLLFDSVFVKDKEGNCFRVHKTDERWLSGELKHFNSGQMTVKDKHGNTFRTSTEDSRFISGEYNGINFGMIPVKDNQGNSFLVSKDDSRYISGELKYRFSGTVCVRDTEGNTFCITKEDPRYISGELIPIWKGKHHSEETKQIISEKSKIHQRAEGNSQFGTCWIHRLDFKENKKIKKEELNSFLSEGWVKGRKMKF